MMKRVAAILLLVLAGCGGGGSSTAPHAAAPTATPTAPAQSAVNRGTAPATITISIPSATTTQARSPKYVSPSAQSISISVYPVVGGVIAGSPSQTVNQDLTTSSPGCTGGSPNVCIITFAAQIGTDAFGITLYQNVGEGGAVLSQLAATAATERNIVEGQTNAVLPLVLNGVPASITVSATATTFHGGTPTGIPYTVVVADASGNTIIGTAPFTTPITPTSSDGTAFSFSPPTMTSPSTAVTLQYNGNATALTNTFGATAGAVTAATISEAFLPAPITITCASGCGGLANGNTPYALTVSEAGLNSAVTVSPTGASCNIDPSASVTMAGGTGTVNLYPNPAGGGCTVTATDTYSQTTTSTTNFNAAADPTIVNNCGFPGPLPPDPNGGSLYINSCGNNSAMYGSYYYLPLMSNQNPCSFQVAIYANTANAIIRQFTAGGGTCNRYITGANVLNPNLNFVGQAGTTSIPYAALDP